ncbi:hypothetical protein XF10_24285 [Salmonella enterica]|nr:hypothetical protein [Salmonella enterica]EAS1785576.1 hypothetical protein [Salmonella enterica]EAS1833666.1 hypothetical protein [Salmonella enterica]EBK8587274.1 hypothetical protein [Salmonella enterica]
MKDIYNPSEPDATSAHYFHTGCSQKYATVKATLALALPAVVFLGTSYLAVRSQFLFDVPLQNAPLA